MSIVSRFCAAAGLTVHLAGSTLRRMDAMRALEKAGSGVDAAVRKILEKKVRGPEKRMYQMLAYFLGFLDVSLKPSTKSAGKRFRPNLTLFLAEAYGVRKAAFDAALAIEFFHNFTLIHDDIEDRDEMRRGRPTVWKLWGVHHAMNSGDALSLIATELCAKSPPQISRRLFETFSQVIEGQYLDFELAEAPLHSSEETYLAMIEKKSGALIGVSAEVAGIAGKRSTKECALLQQYGMTLGIAYQIADDFYSVWASTKETGKDAQSDIREKKRTLPILFTYAHAPTSVQKRLKKLYDMPRALDRKEIKEVLAIVNATAAREDVLAKIKSHAHKARSAVEKLSLPKEARVVLSEIVDTLVPLSV